MLLPGHLANLSLELTFCQGQWRKTIEKVGGGQNLITKFFIIPFTTSSCVARVSCARTQKVKNCRKCVAMQSICYWYRQYRGTFFFWKVRGRAENRKFRFASKLPDICINETNSLGIGSCTFSSH